MLGYFERDIGVLSIPLGAHRHILSGRHRQRSGHQSGWAFILREQSEGVTRLVVRERYRYLRGWARFIVEPVAIVSFVMTRKMLRGIRQRAEAIEATA